MESTIFDDILAQLKETPTISIVRTSVNNQNATFTIYQALPCSNDIYAVFIDFATNSLYALQNTGAQFWIKYSNDLGEAKYFLLPITNFLIQEREACLGSFVKSCRLAELGSIPIRKEQFVTPFMPPQIIEGLLANYA
jgi:hypothetical protein